MAAIFADIFNHIFMNEKFCILIQISLKFVRKSVINNKAALVHVMAWRRSWTNVDPVHWRIYAALGGDELTITNVNNYLF